MNNVMHVNYILMALKLEGLCAVHVLIFIWNSQADIV